MNKQQIKTTQLNSTLTEPKYAILYIRTLAESKHATLQSVNTSKAGQETNASIANQISQEIEILTENNVSQSYKASKASNGSNNSNHKAQQRNSITKANNICREISKTEAESPLLEDSSPPISLQYPETQCSKQSSFQQNSIHNNTEPKENSDCIQKLSFERLSIEEKNSPTKMSGKVDVVHSITGEWGKWQLRTVLLIFLCKIPSSWFMACIIFTAPLPRHGEFYCKPPDSAVPLLQQNKTDWVKISHPVMEDKDDKEFSIDFCNVYEDALEHVHQYYHSDNTTLPWDLPNRTSNIVPCESFEHHADYTSIITQFDLVCSRNILIAVTQFFHLFGVLVGGILATKLLESISPRRVMLIGMFSQIACGNLTGLVASYELHVFFRCLSAVCCAQMYTAGQMIFQDITGGKYKTIVTTLFEQFWSIGVILLPGVASFWSSWSHLYMAISMPTFLLIFLHHWIPDSPSWLLKRGYIQEAKDILIASANFNKRSHILPNEDELELQLRQQSDACLKEPEEPGWWSIWQEPRAKINLICVHLAWSIYIVVYYGMLLNIKAFSREHYEINTVIAGLSEITGVFIGLYLILNTTRKWLWTGLFNIVAGCIAYTAWLVPTTINLNERVVLLMVTAMISKIAISCTLAILTTSTTELVCQEKKRICGFSTIVWARIWLLTAPFVGATIIFGQLIPQTAFASLSILGGLITSLIIGPRTLPKPKKLSKYPPEFIPEIWTVKPTNEKINV